MSKSVYLFLAAVAALIAGAWFWRTDSVVVAESAPEASFSQIQPEAGEAASLQSMPVLDTAELDDLGRQAVAQIEKDFASIKDFRIQVTSLQAQFPSLLIAMRAGDAAAARALENAIYRCSGYFDMPFSVRSFKAHMDAISDPEGQFQDLSEQEKERLRAIKRFEYGICGNVTREQREVRREALEMLAELGDAEARMAFAMLPVPAQEDFASSEYFQVRDAFTTKADHYLELELKERNISAFDVAGLLYGRDLAGNPFRNCCNPGKNLAYQMAAVKVLKGKLKEAVPGSAEFNQISEDIARRDLAIEAAQGNFQLTDIQVEEARAQAEQIVERCCGA